MRHAANPYNRFTFFLNEEQAKLLPLPACDFETYAEKTATVSRDFHIQFDSAFYSVPDPIYQTQGDCQGDQQQGPIGHDAHGEDRRPLGDPQHPHQGRRTVQENRIRATEGILPRRNKLTRPHMALPLFTGIRSDSYVQKPDGL